MSSIQPRLQVEFLEPRVLLATGDSPGSGIDTAIQTGLDISLIDIDLHPFNKFLTISGPGYGNLLLDLSQLPESVMGLTINSFDTVTFTGEHAVDSLVLSDIMKVDAGRISIGSQLKAYDVEYIKIDAAPETVWIQGARDASAPDRITIGLKTLLEAGSFSTSPNALIFSGVASLGLSTTSRVASLPTIASYPSQTVLLNFQPDAPIRVPSEVQVSVLSGGDFAGYFLASPREQLELVRLQAIASHPALVERISLSTMLGYPAVHAIVSEMTDTVHSRPLADIDTFNARLSVDASPVSGEPIEDHGSGTAPRTLEPLQPIVLSQSVGAQVQADAGQSDASSVSSMEGPDLGLQSTARQNATESVLSAVAVGLARLSEPFVQLVSDVQGRFATFGDIAASRLTDHLRTESRPALLVDARSARPRDSRIIQVVDV